MSWKEANNLPQDGDKLPHLRQTFAHLLHLATHDLHFLDNLLISLFTVLTFLNAEENLPHFLQTFAHLLQFTHNVRCNFHFLEKFNTDFQSNLFSYMIIVTNASNDVSVKFFK